MNKLQQPSISLLRLLSSRITLFVFLIHNCSVHIRPHADPLGNLRSISRIQDRARSVTIPIDRSGSSTEDAILADPPVRHPTLKTAGDNDDPLVLCFRPWFYARIVYHGQGTIRVVSRDTPSLLDGLSLRFQGFRSPPDACVAAPNAVVRHSCRKSIRDSRTRIKEPHEGKYLDRNTL